MRFPTCAILSVSIAFAAVVVAVPFVHEQWMDVELGPVSDAWRDHSSLARPVSHDA
ncbi:hypothetical protein BV25DRAFT_1833526 [Artomyces pyxidatus]|uniref:Uncharacterized protein n=1 Tax=Artomyces pyxidatus TaxID=48021 RepID=A0ACB8SFV6_9AGAM|nr:hypothetical protein BV25DRAFT_1833526 [Artomyces pyxidatus]